jgi:hypothetical protein
VIITSKKIEKEYPSQLLPAILMTETKFNTEGTSSDNPIRGSMNSAKIDDRYGLFARPLYTIIVPISTGLVYKLINIGVG